MSRMKRNGGTIHGSGGHAYPSDLTDLVLRQWADVQRACGAHCEKPSRDRLRQALSACYQASLLNEEGRPVTFRLALAEPESFAPDAGPPTGLHRVVFTEPRPLDQHELRRLSPAAAFSRSFIGARLEGGTGPTVWGLIHSGPDWLQSVRGGRETLQAIPPVPTIAVTGPGRVLVDAGATMIADLSGGSLIGGRIDVFEATWMARLFADLGAVQWAAYAGARQPGDPALGLSPAFGPVLARQVLRRILAGIRTAHHGGMLLILPEGRVTSLLGADGCVRIKYAFADEEPRRRLLTLSIRIMNELWAAHGDPSRSSPIGWIEYAQSEVTAIKELDAALFEVAHFVADLAQVDGAVVLTDRLDVIGFGGEIAARGPELTRVSRALDLEGTRREWVRTDRVGTRHRSAYRLCQEAHDVVAVVVSQDGGLRFVRWHDNAVTYWDQVATGPWEA